MCPEGRGLMCIGGNDAWRNRTRLHRGAGTWPGCHPGVRTQPANHDAERGGCGKRACSPHGTPDAAYAGGTWVCPGDARGFALTPRVLELGMAYIGSTNIWEIARPHM